MEKEEEEGTEKSVTEQALRESRAKFLSITVLFKKGRQLEHTQQLRWKALGQSLGRKWISISRPARKTVPNYSGTSWPCFLCDQICGHLIWKSIFCHWAWTKIYEENRWERIYSRKFLSVENGAKEFAICYHTDGTDAQCVIIKEKKVLFADVFLPLVLQQLYLHGLHHKLSWSSPNKARHFFGVFASVSRTGRHKHTHTETRKQKRKKRKWTRHCTDKNMWPGLRFRLATLGYSPSLRARHQASDPPSPNLPV